MFNHYKITRRLLIVNSLIVGAFLIMLAAMVSSFWYLKTTFIHALTDNAAQMTNNAKFGREWARVLADANYLFSIFYGRDDALQSESKKISNFISTFEVNGTFQEHSTRFQQMLEEVFLQCGQVNQQRADIERTTQQLFEAFDQLDQTVAQKIMNAKLNNKDTSGLEQISYLIPGYRELCLRSQVVFGQLGLEYFKTPLDASVSHPILSILDDLYLQLRALSASETEIVNMGRQLLEDVNTYKEQIRSFHAVATELRVRQEKMQQAKDALLNALEEQDRANEQSVKAVSDAVSQVIGWVLGVCVAAFIAVLPVVGIGVLTARSIAPPIRQMMTMLEQMASGEIPQKLSAVFKGEFETMKQRLNSLIETTDETANFAEAIGNGNLTLSLQERSSQDRLIQALNAMLNSLKLVSKVAEEMSHGDLTIAIHPRSELDTLMQALDTMLAKLNTIVRDVKVAAQYVTSSSMEMHAVAEQLSQGTSQQAAATQEVSSSMQEMAANIHQNLDNAKFAEKIANESAEDAEKGGNAVEQTISAMRVIAERISMIQEIATQTNILSLNASIEASKAQDFGKGFAVVASEVRELAHRTREAAQEIGTLVHSCEVISQEAGEILRRLVPSSRKTAEFVHEISVASHEQYAGAEQINGALQQLDTVTQQNSTTAEEMAASAEVLSTQAKQLQTAMAFFTVIEVKQSPQNQDTELVNTLQDMLVSDTQRFDRLIQTLTALKSSGTTAHGITHPRNPHDQPTHVQIMPDESASKNCSDLMDEAFERF